MHLISTLASGIAGAEDGTVKVYRRGTATLATIYSDFEGTIATQPLTGYVLDAYGGTTLYVNELVDVRVFDSTGTGVRSFVAGVNAGAIEVRSASFTGTDYVSGARGAGSPTTEQSIFDLWVTQNGSTDWRVLLGSSAVTVQAALASMYGIFRNVKSPTYGAVGDGATDDTTAIQAALDAGTGIVFFPVGTYKQTGKLTVPAGVSLWGAPGTATTLNLAHATADQLEYGAGTDSTGYQEIRGLLLQASQANSGTTIAVTTAGSRTIAIINSYIGGALNTGHAIGCAAPVGAHRVIIDSSTVVVYGTAALGVTSASNFVYVEARNSFFLAGVDQWGGSFLSGRNIVAVACTFDASVVTTGAVAYTCIDCFGTAGYGAKALITGNRFIAGSAGVGYAMYSSYCDEATTSYVETGNALVGTFTGDVYGHLLRASANRPRISLSTRDTRIKEITDNTAAVTIPSDQYGVIWLRQSAAVGSAQTITATPGPEGAYLTVVLYNNTGGPLTAAEVFGTGFVATTPTVNPGNGKLSIYNFRMIYASGGQAWVPTGAAVTTT